MPRSESGEYQEEESLSSQQLELFHKYVLLKKTFPRDDFLSSILCQSVISWFSDGSHKSLDKDQVSVFLKNSLSFISSLSTPWRTANENLKLIDSLGGVTLSWVIREFLRNVKDRDSKFTRNVARTNALFVSLKNELDINSHRPSRRAEICIKIFNLYRLPQKSEDGTLRKLNKYWSDVHAPDTLLTMNILGAICIGLEGTKSAFGEYAETDLNNFPELEVISLQESYND